MRDFKIIVVSGASGTGKTTAIDLIGKILHPHPTRMLESVTTRPPRPDDGALYHCVTPDAFDAMEEQGQFAWVRRVHACAYGTAKQALKDALLSEASTLTILTPNTLLTIRDALIAEGGSESSIFFIHMLSPEESVLRARLTARGDTTPELIEYRIKECKEWDEYVETLPLSIHRVENNGTIEDLKIALESIVMT